jgi:hypothetical protein
MSPLATMKNQEKSSQIVVVAWFFAVMFPDLAVAACTRSDVDYYLEKGFTREQVVAICTGRSLPKGGVEPIPNRTPLAPTLSAPPIQKPAEDLEDFLRSAIDGYDVQLTDKALHYTRKTCIEYGPYNQFGIKTEACPDVRYSITREGMEVRKIKQAMLIFGNYEVIVTGRIDRRILDLNRYKSALRPPIQAHLESGNETLIPIRDGIPRERLEAVLRELPAAKSVKSSD